MEISQEHQSTTNNQDLSTEEIEFSDIFWHAPIGVAVANRTGHFIKANQHFCDLLGYTEHELKTLAIADLTHPEDRNIGLKECKYILKNHQKEFFSVDKRYIRKNGEVFWGNISLAALKDKRGENRPFTVGILKDISEQKAAEKKLRLSESLFSSAFNNAGIGMALVDTQGHLIEVNRAFSDFLGYSKEQMKTIDFQSITHPDDLSADLLQFEALLAGELSAYAMHKRYIHASGEIRWGALSVSIARDESGDIDYVIAQVQDIHQQKMRENHSRAQARIYETIFSSAFTFMALLSADGIIQEVNVNAIALTGRDRESLVNYALDKSYWFQGLPEQQQRIKAAIERARQGENVDEEVKMVTVKGILNINFSLRPVKDAFNHVTHLIVEGHDITTLKAKEKQLQQQAEQLLRQNQDLADFTHIASHDLQEPLRKIRAFGERLADKETLTERGSDFLNRMNKSSERMQHMIRDLLNYSKVSSQQNTQDNVNLNECLNEVLESISLQLEETEGKIEVSELPELQASPLHMHQLFQNLLSNALKFTPADRKPHITVKCSFEGATEFQIDVQDNGIGFEDNFSERIFQPFQRLHGRHEYAGSGIGLAICRKIVEHYQGKIWAKSQPDNGSCFSIVLPFEQSGPEEVSE